MKTPNCCARDVKPGDRVWVPTGVVKVVSVEPSRGGIEAKVSQGSQERFLWWWPQEGVHVQKRARRAHGCVKTASAGAR